MGKLKPSHFETIDDPRTEKQQIKELADVTLKLMEMRRAKGQYLDGKIMRGVHAKSHGCAKGTFQVNTDLPSELRVGLFAKPGRSFETLVRYSNAATIVSPDPVRLEGKDHIFNHSQGMGLKLLGVVGERDDDDDGVDEQRGGRGNERRGGRGRKEHQDFLMINSSAFAVANVSDYLILNKHLLASDDNLMSIFLPENISRLDAGQVERFKRLAQVAQSFALTNVANPLQIQFFGAAPFLFGADRVMRVSADPVDKPEPVRPDNPSDNFLREAVVARMAGGAAVVYDFKIQVRGPGPDLHIENAQRDWDESVTPFQSVARLTLPTPQTVSPTQDGDECEPQAFSPWHTLADHQPLGGINRLRRRVYRASRRHRRGER